jgi:hypothetical protein
MGLRAITGLGSSGSICPVPSVLACQYTRVVKVVLTRCRTQGGIFTTPGDAYTTPVDMWVKALGEHFFLRGIKSSISDENQIIHR